MDARLTYAAIGIAILGVAAACSQAPPLDTSGEPGGADTDGGAATPAEGPTGTSSLPASSSSSSSSGSSGSGTNAAMQDFIANVYPLLKGTCAGCHAVAGGQAPTFFGADGPSTYSLFKSNGFDSDPVITQKGAHEGPAMTQQEVQVTQQWQQLEAAAASGSSSSSSGGATGGAAGSGAKCAAQTTGSACLSCCVGTAQSAYDLANNAFGMCVCQTPGTCAAQCAASFCNGQAQTAGDACDTCLNGATQCQQQANTACNANPTCAAVTQCIQQASCTTKP